MTERVQFECNGEQRVVDVEVGESLLSVLRERLQLTSVKDGCAPQGQCGCCTVLVDGGARVACVTPVTRVAGRSVTTLEGLDPQRRDALAGAFLAHGASQCGFCTPGIVMRCAALIDAGKAETPAAVQGALAAHLCRCTGWQGIVEAVAAVVEPGGDIATAPPAARDLDAAGRRATLEGGAEQRVALDVVLGHGGFADDEAVDRAPMSMVAVPVGDGYDGATSDIDARRYVTADSLFEARSRAAKVQGRRSTIAPAPPMAPPAVPDGGVALATSWVEPAYLEPDASWCAPGGVPATPLANGGAFGAKTASSAPAAARALADAHGGEVRVVWSREDVVRWGPKRAPIAASARYDDGRVVVRGRGPATPEIAASPYGVAIDVQWETTELPGPSVSHTARAPFAEIAVLVEGALDATRFDRAAHVDGVAAAVLLDTCVGGPDGAFAGARVALDAVTGALQGVEVRVGAGRVLDEIVLRSYCIGAVHMALGWVLREGLAVDDDGEVHDLTIRSFGVLRAKDMPPVQIEIVDDDRAPCRGSDAVFAATAAACWNALTRAEGARPTSFPASDTRASRLLRR